MHWWKLLHTGCCCYWSTHFKRFQEQNEEHNLPLSLGNIWDIANPGQAPDNCVEVGRNKQKTNSKVQTRYSNNGVRHTHLWCENWKNETCTEHAIKQSTLAVLQPNMQLVKDSLVNLMSMLKLCHIWKHQMFPDHQRRCTGMFTISIHLSLPTQSTTIWCGQDGADYSQTQNTLIPCTSIYLSLYG